MEKGKVKLEEWFTPKPLPKIIKVVIPKTTPNYRREWNREWQRLNRDYEKVQRSNRYYRVKYEIMQILGFKCCKCGNDDIRVLQIDHVIALRNQVANRLYKNNVSRLLHILDQIKHGSKNYQILCANCNWIKRVENGEEH